MSNPPILVIQNEKKEIIEHSKLEQRFSHDKSNLAPPRIHKRDILTSKNSPQMNFLLPPTTNESSLHTSQQSRTHTPLRSHSVLQSSNDHVDAAKDLNSSIRIRTKSHDESHINDNEDEVEDMPSPVKVIAHRKSSPNVFKTFRLDDFDERTIKTIDEEEKMNSSPNGISIYKQIDSTYLDKQCDSTMMLHQNNVSTIIPTQVLVSQGQRDNTPEIEKKVTEEVDFSIEKIGTELKLIHSDSRTYE